MHPTIIVGTSTVGGAFTEQVVREMAKGVERPMIFPLSNPTELIEAVPADVITWTDGRGLVGTGTPWGPVTYKGVDYQIGQANNALVYPGIGLGTIVSRAEPRDRRDAAGRGRGDRRASSTQIGPARAACPMSRTSAQSSATVAVAVARQAVKDGVAAPIADPIQAVQDAMWQADLSAAGAEVMASVRHRSSPLVPIGTGATGTRVESDSMGSDRGACRALLGRTDPAVADPLLDRR